MKTRAVPVTRVSAQAEEQQRPTYKPPYEFNEAYCIHQLACLLIQRIESGDAPTKEDIDPILEAITFSSNTAEHITLALLKSSAMAKPGGLANACLSSVTKLATQLETIADLLIGRHLENS